MPPYFLYISAELDNLTGLQPQDGCDDPNFYYHFKLKCENCGEVTQKETYVLLSETVPLPTGRDNAHLVQKCKFCGRDGNVKMLPGYGQPLTLEMSQEHKPSKIMLFDCRGFEPIDFLLQDGWKAESTWGTWFNVDLSDDFAEYDEMGQEPVGITNVQASFKVAQKQSIHGQLKYK